MITNLIMKQAILLSIVLITGVICWEPQIEEFDLPLVDMSGPKETIRADILRHMEGIGFLLLENIPGYDENKLLDWAKWFFSKPKEEKTKLAKHFFNKESSNVYRGYVPFLDNDTAYKEMFEVGSDFEKVSPKERQTLLHEATPFPAGDGTPEGDAKAAEFEKFCKDHYQFMSNLGLEILGYLAEALDIGSDYFHKFFEKDSLATFRIMRY